MAVMTAKEAGGDQGVFLESCRLWYSSEDATLFREREGFPPDPLLAKDLVAVVAGKTTEVLQQSACMAHLCFSVHATSPGAACSCIFFPLTSHL